MGVIHGDAFENILGKDNEYSKILQNISNFEHIGDIIINGKNGHILQNDLQEVNFRVIILYRENSYNLETFYPNFSNGSLVSIEILEIREDENQVEAYIVGEILTNHEIKRKILFIATDYILNKEKYFVGNKISISLSSTPVVLGIAKEYFEVNYNEEILNALGIDIKYDKDGNIEPTKFYTNLLTYIMESDKTDVVYEFMASIEEEENLKISDIEIKKLLLSINLGGEDDNNIIKFPMYFNKEKYSEITLEKGVKIQGFLEFHGFLVK
ncbi:hypothetical protein DLH72_00705 [Candidatus Gracilibacteria bacterium]|nr:MAG: hypothetical protein DLH72_00705 [Candidatus Gracilibacteria bacterium]